MREIEKERDEDKSLHFFLNKFNVKLLGKTGRKNKISKNRILAEKMTCLASVHYFILEAC